MGRWGQLYYKGESFGEAMPLGKKQITPWGTLYWIGIPTCPWGPHGWVSKKDAQQFSSEHGFKIELQ